MPAKIVYERFLWFHNQVKAEKYPNSRILAERFELSQKTAQRDIEFIRDRLNAPLVYVPANSNWGRGKYLIFWRIVPMRPPKMGSAPGRTTATG